MPKRQYDPQLIWGYLSRYAEQFPDRPPGSRVQAYFYLLGKEGTYYLNNGPRLYWDENLGDGYFVKIDPGRLESDAAHLREVVVLGLKRNKKDEVLFQSYEKFLIAIGMEIF